MKITDIAVEHRISVYVLIGVLVLAGAMSYASLPREAAPEIDMPVILVTTTYMGVSPEDIETLITHPIEKELKEIKDIEKLTSTSAESASIIVIEFGTGVDLNEANQEVREKVDLAIPKLPKDADETIVKALSTSDFPMMIVNVTGPYDLIRLRDVAEDLQDEIENVQGVLDVKLAGGVEREIQVRVNPDRLNHFGVALDDVTQALQGENINMPGGNIDIGDASFLVRVPGEFENVEEIRGIIVKMKQNVPVYLVDVADVVDSYKERTSFSRLDGRNNVSLTVTKRPGENLLIMSNAIKEVISLRSPALPEGTEIVILGDQSKDVDMMVSELENNILSGLILVIAVIMLAMGFRNSALVGVAIPMSMLISFAVLAVLDITLNMIVLFSLILALGMLVDNAIVIVENIYRHATEGKDPVQASMDGTREVAWPVFTSTMTTVAAFFPLLFWPGINGEFMGYLPQTLIITLLASLFVAIIINPVLCAAFLKVKKVKPTASASKSNEPSVFVRGYESLLRGAIKYRKTTVGVGFVIFVGTFVVFGGAGLGVEFFPEATPRKIFLEVDAGDGTRVEFSDRFARKVETAISDIHNIEHYVADVGVGGGDPSMGMGGNSVPYLARFSVDFKEKEFQNESPEKTVEGIRAAVKDLPGARIEVKKEPMGPPAGAPVTIELYGDDFTTLGRLALSIRDLIADVDGLIDLKDDFQAGRPELRVEVDRQRAKILGADTRTVASTVRTAINGTKASVLRDGEDEYDITVRLDRDYRQEISDIESLRINVKSKTDPDATYLVPIGAVANIVAGGGKGSIKHKELKRVVTVSGNVEGKLPAEVVAVVRERMKGFKMPAAYTYEFAGEDKEAKKSQDFLTNAFLVALFLIALILVTQFNSIILPTIIMLSVFLSLVGVLWGQLIMQLPFGIIMTGLGVISLAGIVVNNGIVLVDYIQQTRARGVERDQALVESGLVRFRPVILTAVTTVLGLMPMAVGISFDFATLSLQIGGRSAEFWKSMSIAVISGLIVATVLTLVVVPVLYSLFDDFEQWFSKTFRRKASLPAVAVDEGATP